MLTFVKWYFPIKLIVAIIIMTNDSKAGNILTLLVGVDILVVPLIMTIIIVVKLIFRRKRLAPGEYKIKPEGKRI